MMTTDSNQSQWLLPVILAGMTLLTSALLMISNQLTADKIAAQKTQAKLASLQRLIPAELADNDLIKDAKDIFEPVQLGHRQQERLYLGTLKGQPSVMAIPVIAHNGYSGDIELLVGVQTNGHITGIEIIAHKETPGLGDLIQNNKSDWLLQFPGKSLQNPGIDAWRVKKDRGHFDQITAATITPRAVVAAIKKALLFQQQYQQQLMEAQHE